jgi:hypothetical protein
VASFLGRHGKKQGMLPALILVQTTRAGKLPVDARRTVTALFGLP